MSATTRAAARATKRIYNYQVWMPTLPMTLINARNASADGPAKATFRVAPRMTKHEVKEYLTKIYNLPVTSVNTTNFDGNRKRVYGKRKVAFYKYRDWKKAIVTFDAGVMTDVGERIGDLLDSKQLAELEEVEGDEGEM
mmetsp:Transcript_33158/g.40688  ORF Transcript_33158/g.40688 Transcript_33158/m.40688 type:complete len:139 (+) Transcript_33158:371-787(+)|eukprot:CAMPEP_0172517658 /NCGR_PEP_ID=MMETSP1066-20121228/286889_1 /TAXON_ID=671091 /ORGANISM="Coscinodiscus wailesii, Strain CCMP2513" /LENGTH=138 /DNA_ID=CAMNT_0013299777 /DNA_START=366 /DNA_END=782 /DNA_ORIENTATION=+